MYTLFTQLIDALFPPAETLRAVRAATFDALAGYAVPRRVHRAYALAPYRATLVRALVHEAKFRHNRRAIELLGTLLAHALVRHPRSSVHVVPLPLARARARERGYNQVLEIVRAARAVAPQIVLHDGLLVKERHTKPQTSLDRTARQANLAGAFRVTLADAPRDTYLILVDDVMTTGSTFAEATAALRSAGYRNVECLALAH